VVFADALAAAARYRPEASMLHWGSASRQVVRGVDHDRHELSRVSPARDRPAAVRGPGSGFPPPREDRVLFLDMAGIVLL
jgi:hypothetical protein